MRPRIAPNHASLQFTEPACGLGQDHCILQAVDWIYGPSAEGGDQSCTNSAKRRLGLDRGTMTANSFCNHSLLRAALVLLFAAAAYSASAQVVPGLRWSPDISAFGTFTAVKPDVGYYGDLAVYGPSVGGFWQTRHIIGVEVRGSILRWGGLEA